ncbi:MAG: nitroreductase [Actinophytocola sp.]|uniref:Acg family FMN-binding oxidoreductase n=1 Tax=Actinophytocola sp. TaxID=1872138 RepID=UPI00132058CE|nr:nitroreductase family protein [Actinophytocola sp.]MPZ81795.1 nitroreductase [Actinophytocola sp.]
MSTSDTTPHEVIDRALHAATRAPSVHNTQPWRFVVAPPRVELHLDRERVLSVADPDAREAQLSCGAALLNLTLALRAADHAVVTDLLPDPTRPDHLATVRIGGYRMPSPEIRSLATAIHRRATNRRPFHDRPVPAALRQALVHAAEQEGAQLTMLDTPRALETFADLLRRADHLQEEDPAFQAELRMWTTGVPGRPDGVPRSAGGPRPIGGELLKLRHYHHGVTTPRREFEQEPLVAVLTSAGDTIRDRLRAGQAMQRVLLSATTTGLGVSFLSQPIEVPYIRAAVRTLLGGRRHPQTALRIGYGDPAAPTPRRSVSAVATFPTSHGVTS